MAFKDITKVFYDGQVKIDYKDKAHRYYARPRIDWDKDEDDAKAWGGIMHPKGTTTLLGETLEKQGLQQWPKNVALRELFGFYGSFTRDDGATQPSGFSKGVGTLWQNEVDSLVGLGREALLPIIQSACDGWQRKQKKGADIGSVVHDAIEHFIKNQPFDIAEQYMWNIKECEYESEALREKAMQEFDGDVVMATNAFLQFQKWWLQNNPKLIGAEDLIYAMNQVHDRRLSGHPEVGCETRDDSGNCHCEDICGTFDGLIDMDVAKHPTFSRPTEELSSKFAEIYHRVHEKGSVTTLCDWKTSNTYSAAPEGVSYDYFIQSAIYAMAWQEMGNGTIDDLAIVSARKDGGFSTVFASDLGWTVPELIMWAKSVIRCHYMMKNTKAQLMAHAITNGVIPDPEVVKAEKAAAKKAAREAAKKAKK